MKFIIALFFTPLFAYISIAQDTINHPIARVNKLDGIYVFINAIPLSEYDSVGSIEVYRSSIRTYSNGTAAASQVDNIGVIRQMIRKAKRLQKREFYGDFDGIIIGDRYQKGTLIKLNTTDEEVARRALVRKWEGVSVYIRAYPQKQFRTIKIKQRLPYQGSTKFISRYIINRVKKVKKNPHREQGTNNKVVKYDGILLSPDYDKWEYFVFEKEEEDKED